MLHIDSQEGDLSFLQYQYEANLSTKKTPPDETTWVS